MTNTYLYELTDIWNDANITFDSIRMVVADTASQTDSTFLKFAISTNTNVRFAVFKAGFFHSGNTTDNLQANATLLKLANSTASANYGLAALNLGANVILNTTAMFLGNSTINALMNSSTLILGANLNLTNTDLKVGNSTINSQVNSSILRTTGTLQFGTRVANTTATITGTIDVLDAGGVTRKLMVCG